MEIEIEIFINVMTRLMEEVIFSWSIKEKDPWYILLLWKTLRYFLGISSLISFINIIYFFITFKFIFIGKINDPFLEQIIMFILIVLA